MNQIVQISFSELEPEQKNILIAQLADAGFEGFEETEKGLEAYINKEDFDTSLLEEICFKYQLQFKIKTIENVNWNQLWESNFQPVVLNDFVAIRADFHQPIGNVEYEIVITPKMSFGTGHHATTVMMIELMRDIEFENKKVFDFGTGTGILSILAEKSGAGYVLAVDNDDWSIENAIENCKKNNAKNIFIKKASCAETENKFDIILANINKNIILQNFKSLCNLLNDSGKLLLSGILEEDKQEILKSAEDLNLQFEKELIRVNWVCLKFSH